MALGTCHTTLSNNSYQSHMLIDINKITSQSIVSENRVVRFEPRTEVLSAWYY
jgi:hypothetical protein